MNVREIELKLMLENFKNFTNYLKNISKHLKTIVLKYEKKKQNTVMKR